MDLAGWGHWMVGGVLFLGKIAKLLLWCTKKRHRERPHVFNFEKTFAQFAHLQNAATLAVMKIAFKEWAVVVDALSKGEQVIILRKGGIAEGKEGFKPEYSRFWLFPTLFHQQREAVIESAQCRWDALQPELPAPDRVCIRYYAEVVAWRLLSSLEEAMTLKGHHIWRDEVIASRFDWGKQKNIHALIVRVYRLPVPVELPVVPAYSGCKSWIELEQDLDTTGSQPVIEDSVMQEKVAALQRA